MNDEEKIGGLPVTLQEVEDFAFYVNSCELEEISFKGSPYTWWNDRAGCDCIFERLDRVFSNTALQNWLPRLEVEHIPRIGSDHAHLLLSMHTMSQHAFKP